MNVFLSVIGTRGDLETFLILGRELQRRGHRVTLGTSSFYSPLVRAANLQWMQLGSGTFEQMQAVLRSFSNSPDIRQRTAIYYRGWFQPQLSQSIDAICKAALASDYFISNTKMCLWQDDRAVAGAAVTYDVPASLAELANSESHLSNGRIIELVAMNKKLIDRGDAWGKAFEFTGFWFEPNPPAWAAPDELLRFLSDGPPPVVVTMGSMLIDGSKLLGSVVEALRLAGQRGIVLGDSAAVDDRGAVKPDIFFAKETPYHWLFPQASCVIHHGGMGTVAAVLSAGVPSIVLPQIPAQQRIADVLSNQGLAAGVFDSQTMDLGELAGAIQSAITHPKFAQHAQTWRELIRRDRGVVAAVDLIERHWRELHC
jgi:UDP:flavonoid glycosyltransferase YjiC (YdhE family)